MADHSLEKLPVKHQLTTSEPPHNQSVRPQNYSHCQGFSQFSQWAFHSNRPFLPWMGSRLTPLPATLWYSPDGPLQMARSIWRWPVGGCRRGWLYTVCSLTRVLVLPLPIAKMTEKAERGRKERGRIQMSQTPEGRKTPSLHSSSRSLEEEE